MKRYLLILVLLFVISPIIAGDPGEKPNFKDNDSKDSSLSSKNHLFVGSNKVPIWPKKINMTRKLLENPTVPEYEVKSINPVYNTEPSTTHPIQKYMYNPLKPQKFTTKKFIVKPVQKMSKPDAYDPDYSIPTAKYNTWKVVNLEQQKFTPLNKVLTRKVLSVDDESESRESSDRHLTVGTAAPDYDTDYDEQSEMRVDKRNKEKKQYGKKFRYDPALIFMGLGKRKDQSNTDGTYLHFSNYNPLLKLGSGKRQFLYDPALNYIGLGKRQASYDPALKYMGLGKRRTSYDPALKYMGLGKREPNYDPALKYMGLGKRQSGYDPALKYMGLGKRQSSYDPALKYMGLGKRRTNYDPALKYMGLGKRQPNYDPALKYMGLGKRQNKNIMVTKDKFYQLFPEQNENDSGRGNLGTEATQNRKVSNIDDDIQHERLSAIDTIKRGNKYDPALRYMGLGKKDFSYDPALKFMGLGKRKSGLDNEIIEEKRLSKFDPALKFMGLGKRYNFQQSPSADEESHNGIYSSLVLKRKDKFDPALRFMGLGKRTKTFGAEKIDSQESDLNYTPTSALGGDYVPISSKVMRDLSINNKFPYLDIKNDPELIRQDGSWHQVMNLKPKITSSFLAKGIAEKGKLLDPKVDENGDSSEQNISFDHTFEPFKLSKFVNTSATMGCGSHCDSTRRSKREINYFKTSAEMNIPKVTGEDTVQSYVVYDPPMTRFSNTIKKSALHLKSGDKRDNDHRPKYNPGWIFIGLGKRSGDNKNTSTRSSNKTYEIDQRNPEFKDQPPFVLAQYYDILDKIQNSLQNYQTKMGEDKNVGTLQKPFITISGNLPNPVNSRKSKHYNEYEYISAPPIQNYQTMPNENNFSFWDQVISPTYLAAPSIKN